MLKPAKDIFAFPTATPLDIGDGTEVLYDFDPVQPPEPTAILSPVPPPGIDMGGLGPLQPGRCHHHIRITALLTLYRSTSQDLV